MLAFALSSMGSQLTSLIANIATPLVCAVSDCGDDFGLRLEPARLCSHPHATAAALCMPA